MLFAQAAACSQTWAETKASGLKPLPQKTSGIRTWRQRRRGREAFSSTTASSAATARSSLRRA
ncbi:hypothetical protein [Lysobacter gummosus]|uniref:hypothetical protein n=1 Tax=Lysobacter gummosus TaxID=262324 RepID=UPI003642A4DF